MSDETLMRLVAGLEADGYEIGLDFHGTGYWVRFPDRPVSSECGFLRFKQAMYGNPKLERALLPFLVKHRRYGDLIRSAAKHHPKVGGEGVIAGW